MLSYEEARRVGINACIDKIGRDFCEKNRDYSCAWYGDMEKYAYCGVGISDEDSYHPQERLILTHEEDWLYMVLCNVWYEDGRIEFLKCRIPHLSAVS